MSLNRELFVSDGAWEARKLRRRIAKAERRIAAGKNPEQEKTTKARLEQRLREMVESEA